MSCGFTPRMRTRAQVTAADAVLRMWDNRFVCGQRYREFSTSDYG